MQNRRLVHSVEQHKGWHNQLQSLADNPGTGNSWCRSRQTASGKGAVGQKNKKDSTRNLHFTLADVPPAFYAEPWAGFQGDGSRWKVSRFTGGKGTSYSHD